MIVEENVDWKRKGKRSIVEVVSGLAIAPDRTMLMQKRRPGRRRGEMWEHPGGKVEAGETCLDALVREWREELGVEIVVLTQLACCVIYVESVLVLRLFRVVFGTGAQPQPLDASELRWVTPDEAVMNLTCTPATYAYHDAVCAFMKVQ